MVTPPRVPHTVLVTGASSGIGLELARLFARDGYRLVLVARGQDALERVAEELRRQHGATVTIVPMDLAVPGAGERLVAEIRRRDCAIDILVNNAGFALYGPFAQTDWNTELQMLRVNIEALTTLTKLLLPEMLVRKRGKILNVASTAAFQPGPLMAVYYATKAYVLSFSEALHEEVRGTGVTVTALCPGMTRSGFQARAGLERSRLLKVGMMEAATVARAGYRGLMRGKPVVIPGLKNKLLTFLVRLTPRAWVPRVVRLLQVEE